MEATKSLRATEKQYSETYAKWKKAKGGSKKRGDLHGELARLGKEKARLNRVRREAAEQVGEGIRENTRFGDADAGRHIANLLEAAWDAGVTDKAQVAYIIATADHESLMGTRMVESKKQARHFGYSEKYRGRGYSHLTKRGNYKEVGKNIGVNLVDNPELAADEELSAKILVQLLTKHGRRGHTLDSVGVSEGRTENKLMGAWHTARKAVNLLGGVEIGRAHLIKGVAAKIYLKLGGTFEEKKTKKKK